jgi:predicted nucleic acid-binding Zn ribbon protein
MIEDHKHCVVCGKATAPDKFFCSPSCEETYKKQQKSMARSRMIMMVFFVILFIVIILMSRLGSS